jgi:hypothetical protein
LRRMAMTGPAIPQPIIRTTGVVDMSNVYSLEGDSWLCTIIQLWEEFSILFIAGVVGSFHLVDQSPYAARRHNYPPIRCSSSLEKLSVCDSFRRLQY